MKYRDRLRDTPCVRCGHGHAGRDGHYAADGNTPSFYERCGDWVSAWSFSGASFWPCDCPEWVVAPYRCRCGKSSVHAFPAWLNAVRACSAECAA